MARSSMQTCWSKAAISAQHKPDMCCTLQDACVAPLLSQLHSWCPVSKALLTCCAKATVKPHFAEHSTCRKCWRPVKPLPLPGAEPSLCLGQSRGVMYGGAAPLCAPSPHSRTKPCNRFQHSPSRTGPFTFRMMKRSVSRNFTRTWVTCRRRDSSLKMLHAKPVQVLRSQSWSCCCSFQASVLELQWPGAGPRAGCSPGRESRSCRRPSSQLRALLVGPATQEAGVGSLSASAGPGTTADRHRLLQGGRSSLLTMMDDLQPPTAVLLLKQAFSAGKQL